MDELLFHQVCDVVNVDEIAYLFARTAEPDVLQSSAEIVSEHPVGEHSLIDLAHLPRPGDDAAPIYDRPQPERTGVLGDEKLGSKLRCSVRSPSSVEREILSDALSRC